MTGRDTDSARSAVAGGLAWGAVGVLAFSVSLPATRLAVAGGLDPMFVGVGRAMVAGLVAAVVLVLWRAPLPLPRILFRLSIVALGVVFGFPVLTSLALASVPAAHGIVVVGLLPAATAVMAVLRAGERPAWPFWAASAAGLACVMLFAIVQGAGELHRADLLLLGAVVLCALGYAEGGALARDLGGPRVICWALVLALPITTVLTLPHLDIDALQLATPAAWGGFAYLSLISMFLGFFAWYRGLALGGVARIGQLQLAQPVLSLLWSAVLLAEALTWQTTMAALAVLACVAATQFTR